MSRSNQTVQKTWVAESRVVNWIEDGSLIGIAEQWLSDDGWRPLIRTQVIACY
ncbi:hypothetical protein PND61_08580 [Lacticaseibacillus paracasei]|nr:hypothetical protein [Lacticaseibacillus paracasei]